MAATSSIRVQKADDRIPVEGTRFEAAAAFVAEIPPAVLGTPLTVEFTAHFRYYLQDWEIMTLGVVRADGEPPIKTEMLRKIPVEHALRVALRSTAGLLTDAAGSTFFEVWEGLRPELRRRRAEGPTPRNLESLAEIYRVARVLHDAPLGMIAAAFDLPSRTASHWVKLARERGHLGISEWERRDGEPEAAS